MKKKFEVIEVENFGIAIDGTDTFTKGDKIICGNTKATNYTILIMEHDDMAAGYTSIRASMKKVNVDGVRADKIVGSIFKRLPDVPLIVLGDENIGNKAISQANKFAPKGEESGYTLGYIDAAKAAQSKGMYSVEDLKRAIGKNALGINALLHNLQKKKLPTSVELEIESIQTTKKEDYQYFGNHQSNLNYIQALKITDRETNTIYL